jgi:hypothetical protein
MTNRSDETNDDVVRLDFDRRLRLQFRGSVVTSDAGLLAYRELGLTDGERGSGRGVHGKEWPHALAGLLRQAVFGRLAGYEDVVHLANPGLEEI